MIVKGLKLGSILTMQWCFHTNPPSVFSSDRQTGCPDYIFYKVRDLPQRLDEYQEDYENRKIRFCRLSQPPVCRSCGAQNYDPKKPNFRGRYAYFYPDGSWDCLGCFNAKYGDE